MGRAKYDVSAIYTFAPKISNTSKRIAARKLKSIKASEGSSNALPHFMLNIKCKEPLAPIAQNSDKTKHPVEDNDLSRIRVDVDLCSPQLDPPVSASTEVTDVKKSREKKTERNIYQYQLRTGMMGSKAQVILDDSIFTFRPKVSMASAKIVENLGTDFMARQQQHLERQKRHVSRTKVMLLLTLTILTLFLKIKSLNKCNIL